MPVTSNNKNCGPWHQNWWAYAALAALAGAVLWIDLILPLGVAGGVPYVAVVLVSMWFPSKRLTLGVAIACSALTLVGYAFSPDGGILWVVATNRFLALFAIWATTLLSLGRKQDLQEIEKSERRLRDIVLSSADWTWEVDAEGKYTYASPQVFDILGYHPSEVIGKTSFDLMPPEEAKLLRAQFMEIVQAAKPIRDLENWNVTKNGKMICLLTNGAPIIDGDGSLIGYRGMDKDVTEKKKSIEALDMALKRAEQSNKAKGQFLANMNHELRTPLTIIIGSTEILLEGICGEVNDKQHQFLRRINDSGSHLLTIINDVLDLARLESGEMEMDMYEVDVSYIVREVCQMLSPEIVRAGLELEQEGLGQPINLRGDHLRLRQVMVNLLSNAIKFTQQGTITAYLIQQQDELRLGVRDTGIGISKENFETLFHEFNQVSDVLDNKSRGTGLGLAISKLVAEAHGGTIEVSSELGVGSDFCIVLPYQVAQSVTKLK